MSVERMLLRLIRLRTVWASVPFLVLSELLSRRTILTWQNDPSEEERQAMSYEYTFMASTIALKDGYQQAPGEDLAQGIGAAMGGFGTTLSDALPQWGGGSWDTVSHDVTKIGDNLILTVFLRRPRQ